VIQAISHIIAPTSTVRSSGGTLSSRVLMAG
jgi:hypothetical protein